MNYICTMPRVLNTLRSSRENVSSWTEFGWNLDKANLDKIGQSKFILVSLRIKTNKGVSALTKKLFISTNFLSSPTTAEGLSLLNKFRPKRTNLQMHITRNLSRAKAGQTRLHNKTVINLSTICRKSCDQRVIELKSGKNVNATDKT